MTKTKKARKPQINCCAYDDYNDCNDFLYSTFTEPEKHLTMDETHIEADDSTETYYSNNHISSKTREGDAKDNEVIQSIDQTKSVDNVDVNENVHADAKFEIGAQKMAIDQTPKVNCNNEEEQEAYGDTGSLFTADIDDITINDVKVEDLEFDFPDVLIVKDSCDIHSDSSAVLIDEESDKNNIMSAKNDDENSSNEVDDWDVLSLTQHLNNQDFSCDWDAISSVQSVMSIGTFHTQQSRIAKTLTYKDILSKGRQKPKILSDSNNSTDNNESLSKNQENVVAMSSPSLDGDQEGECNKCNSSLMLPQILEDEKCSLSAFDAYHELEGYKYSRGGKNPYQFRRKKNRKAKKKP